MALQNMVHVKLSFSGLERRNRVLPVLPKGSILVDLDSDPPFVGDLTGRWCLPRVHHQSAGLALHGLIYHHFELECTSARPHPALYVT